MKKIIRILLLLTGIIGGSLLLTGCQEKTGHPASITLIHAWGGTEKDHVAMRNIYEEFQKENPDITLQIISMPAGKEMMKKVEDMIMVGNLPDIVSFSGMAENSVYDFMVENNMVLDIKPYMQQDKEFSDSISAANKEYWETQDGKLYSVADVLMLSGGYWYNEDILKEAGIEEVPKSWDEFQNMCNRISTWSIETKAEVKALQLSAEGYLYCMDHMLTGEESIRLEKSELIFRDEPFDNAVERMKKMYQLSIFKNPEYSYRDETHLFNEGKLAIYINGVWGAPMITGDIHAKYALLPTNTGKAVSCESSGLGYVLGNSGNREREDASVRFLKYMLSESVQTRILEETEQIPANPEVSLDAYKESKGRLYQAASLVLGADEKIEVPSNIWSLSQEKYFTENIFHVLVGDMPVQEFEKNLKGK